MHCSRAQQLCDGRLPLPRHPARPPPLAAPSPRAASACHTPPPHRRHTSNPLFTNGRPVSGARSRADVDAPHRRRWNGKLIAAAPKAADHLGAATVIRIRHCVARPGQSGTRERWCCITRFPVRLATGERSRLYPHNHLTPGERSGQGRPAGERGGGAAAAPIPPARALHAPSSPARAFGAQHSKKGAPTETNRERLKFGKRNARHQRVSGNRTSTRSRVIVSSATAQYAATQSGGRYELVAEERLVPKNGMPINDDAP
ncbi:unnamed protein product, partial [Iphiclides podalirius]